MFTDEGLLQTACLRYFNVFGPRQDPNSPDAAVVRILISSAMRNGAIMMYGDGEPTRDFLFVSDVVAANVFLATQSRASGVLNVAYGKKSRSKNSR